METFYWKKQQKSQNQEQTIQKKRILFNEKDI
jgi:hypothetical protein